MNTKKRIFAASLAALAALVAVCLPAVAEDKWPSKPIKYIVPFPPGGTTDILARLIGAKLATALGQPVLVDNKPGAGGNIGSDFVAKSAPDGYTILGGTISSHAINVSMYKQMPYDPIKDFQAVTLIGTNANVLIVDPKLAAKNVKELIAMAKAKPGSMSFASAGNGTSQHLSGELFKAMAGLDMVHIPYKGSAPAISDVMGGQVPMMFDTTVVAAPHIKSGNVRALAVTSAKRVKGLDTIPTMAEAGVPGYELVSWQGVFAPAGTPKDIVKRLQSEIVKILAMPDIRERLDALGVEPVGNTPEEFSVFQKAEITKWAKVIKDAHIEAN
ncbi:MAG: tripartite tricarboxylate transporter substrate binding protein [Betaproteobacteria bacterium]|nr:tripartite tricarboxylate transporter substrate binding protein [Betaproteobacteria bacterium]